MSSLIVRMPPSPKAWCATPGCSLLTAQLLASVPPQSSADMKLVALPSTLIVGASQPLVLAAERLEQGDYDLRMAAMNVSFAFAIGGGFGAIAGRLSKLPLEERIAGVAKTMDDLVKSQPVDLNQVVKPHLERTDINAIIRSHIAGEDIRGKSIAESGDPVFGRAVDYIQERELRPMTGKDLINAIMTPRFLRSELDNLIASKIDDIGEIGEALRLSGKKSLTIKEKNLLDAFKKGDKEHFEEIIKESESKLSPLDKRINRAKGKLAKLEKEPDKIELDPRIKETIKVARRRNFTETEIKKFVETERNKKDIDLFVKRQSAIEDKKVDINRLMDEKRALKSKIANAKNRIEQVGERQPELRFDTAKFADEIIEEPKIKENPILKDVDEIDPEDVVEARQRVDDLGELETLSEADIDADLRIIEDIKIQEKRLPEITQVYKAIARCLSGE